MIATKYSKINGGVSPDNIWPDDYTFYRGLGGGAIPGNAFYFIAMSNCDDYVEKYILFHERIHAVQWLHTYMTATYNGTQSLGIGIIPTWMKEGQAQY